MSIIKLIFMGNEVVEISIKAMRERAGITQEELAARFGIDQTSVVGWEKGKWLPKTARLMELAKVFGCTVDELLAPDKPQNS